MNRDSAIRSMGLLSRRIMLYLVVCGLLCTALCFQTGCSFNGAKVQRDGEPDTPQAEKSAGVKEAAITQTDSEKTLVSDNICCISVGVDSVWVGTDRGVSVYHKTDDRWTKLDREDGLPHNGILSIAIDGGFIWLGTHSGLTRYDLLTQTWTIYTEGFDWDGL